MGCDASPRGGRQLSPLRLGGGSRVGRGGGVESTNNGAGDGLKALAADEREARQGKLLQAWLRHADMRTMERYRHYRPQSTAAQRIGRIFGRQEDAEAAVLLD